MSVTVRYSMIGTLAVASIAMGLIGFRAMYPLAESPAPVVAPEERSEPVAAQQLCLHMMDQATIDAMTKKSREDSNYGPNWQPPTYCGTREQLSELAAYLSKQVSKKRQPTVPAVTPARIYPEMRYVDSKRGAK